MTDREPEPELYGEDEWAAIAGWSPPHPSPGVAGWRRSSAAGAVFAAALLGLRDALEPERDEEPAIVVDHAGEPDDAQAPVSVTLDPDDPSASVAVLRTWVVRPPQ